MKKARIILITLLMSALFGAFSLTANADPLTAAMMASGMISGMGFTQIAGATAASSGVFSMPSGYTDPLEWDDATNWTNGDFKVRIDRSETSGNVDITLSNGIAKNGYARLSALQSAYGLQPGQTHVVGGYPAIDGYIFYNQKSGYYYGGDIGVFGPSSSYVAAQNIYLTTNQLESNSQFTADVVMGNFNTHLQYFYVPGSYIGEHVVLYLNNYQTGLAFGVRESFHAFTGYMSYSNTGIAVTTENINVTRDSDSVMTDPVTNDNVVTIPENYVSNYQSSIGTDIATKSDVEAILNAIYEAYNNDEVDDSVYLPAPGPVVTPAPADDILTGVNNITGQLGELEGTLEGVGEQVGTISEALEGVESGVETIGQALTVPSVAEAQGLKLPDLRTLFPFCIPFDVYNIITAFNVEPQAPHIQIPFNIPAIGLQYTFDLDFAPYNGVASILRTLEFVAFAVGLAILTSKVIRW